jgi:hypothetical protein
MCLILLPTEYRFQANYSKSLAYISIVVTLSLGVNFTQGLRSQTYEFKSLVLSGMTSSREDAPELDKTMLAIEKTGIESQHRFI